MYGSSQNRVIQWMPKLESRHARGQTPSQKLVLIKACHEKVPSLVKRGLLSIVSNCLETSQKHPFQQASSTFTPFKPHFRIFQWGQGLIKSWVGVAWCHWYFWSSDQTFVKLIQDLNESFRKSSDLMKLTQFFKQLSYVCQHFQTSQRKNATARKRLKRFEVHVVLSSFIDDTFKEEDLRIIKRGSRISQLCQMCVAKREINSVRRQSDAVEREHRKRLVAHIKCCSNRMLGERVWTLFDARLTSRSAQSPNGRRKIM